MKINKRRLEHLTEEGCCESCGMPLYYPEDSPVYEIVEHEEFIFCSRSCAAAHSVNEYMG
jgi:hypothetical protein